MTMRSFRLLSLVASVLVVSSSARAEYAAPRPDARVAPAEAPVQTRAAGVRAAAPRLRVPPPPVLDDSELRDALEGSRVDVQGCLVQGLPGRASSVRASVRLDRASRLTISLTLRPEDAMTRVCIDTAVRRWVQPLQGRGTARVRTASIVVRNGRTVRPPHPPQHPLPPDGMPPPFPGQFDESQVHSALDAMRASLIECVPDVSAGIAGRITLRVTVHPDGSMALVGVDLPSGVRGPRSLSCLSGRITWLRVSPPPGDRTIVHHVQLGR